MVTATIDRDEQLIPLSEMSRTKAAQEKLCALEGELGTVTARFSRYATILQPTHEPQQEKFTDDDRLEAIERIDATRVAHAKLNRAVIEARTAEERAREADREELHCQEHALLRAEAAKLLAAARALEVAMVRFRKIQVRAHECGAGYLDAIGPSGFLPSSGTGQRVGEVELLEIALREHKLID